ncbi:tetratricopeptide repeat protein [Nocardiopsis sp. NPDC050513]|uniref:tetratricopeptide repeat protein n=1 Tax=Nocardiopsis sp. NPDC050513 TaxID=3364338 RepID=UPI0037951CF5
MAPHPGDSSNKAGKDEHRPRGAVPQTRTTLPEPTVGFSGRDRELAALLEMLNPDSEDGSTGVLISGTGGIGKTELVMAAGHTALQRGWFSGTLFVDLRGQDTDPATADQALESLLRALEVPSADIPPLVAGKQALYESRLDHNAAENGGPLLVIADNASDAAQVQPLTPRAGSHRLLMTARSDMDELPVHRLPLDTLSTENAVALMASVLDVTNEADERVAADPASAREIATACGGLPLALWISAAMLRDEPDRPLSHLAADLTGHQESSWATVIRSKWWRRTTERQEYSESSGDTDRAITRLLDHAVAALPSGQRNLFILLAVAPGRDITSAAAAVLIDATPEETSHLLRELASARLVNYSPGTGRWSMHDLVHTYARTRTNVGHGGYHRDALLRLLDHYKATARMAVAHLEPPSGGEKPTGFTDREEALAWLDAERTVLIDAVHTAERIGHTRVAIDLPSELASYLQWRRAFTDQISVSTVARETAHRTGEPVNEAGAWNNLGTALRELRRFGDAIEALRTARALFAESGAESGEATAGGNLGNVLCDVGRFEEGIEAHQRRLAYCRKVGDHRGEAMASNNLGAALNNSQRFEEAIELLNTAHTLCAEIGDRRMEAAALNNLGTALREVNRLEEAVTAHRSALACFQEIGNRHDEAGAWRSLGNTLRKLKRFEESASSLEKARTLYAEVGDRRTEADTWHNLGHALRMCDRSQKAVTALQNARALYAQVGDRGGEAGAWYSLGAVLHNTGRFEDAIAAYQHEIAYRQETGDAESEAVTSYQLGSALRKTGRFEEAVAAYQHVIAYGQETGDAEGEAEVWYRLGFVLPELGRLDEAKEAMEKVLTLSAETGNDRRQGSARRMLDWLRKQTGGAPEGA